MKTIKNIIRKEFSQLKRDRRFLIITILPPVLQLIILGYAANLDVKDLPLLICDMDNSSRSRQLISSYTNSGYFKIADYIDDIRDVDRYLDNNKAAMALIIPVEFEDDLTAGRSAQLSLIVDGAETNSASVGLNYASMIIGNYSQDIITERLIRSGQGVFKLQIIEPELRIWYNPDLKSRNFMVPGVLALLLMVVTIILTSLAIVKEKESGTIEQLIVTPIKPVQLIVGKLTPFFIIAIVDIILVLCVSYFWFRVPIKGNIFLLFGLCLIFLLNTLGIGLFVSTIAKNQQQAMMTAVFFFMMPMIFLSGFVFPIENMPILIQHITYLFPLRYFFVIIRGMFLKGLGIYELWDEGLALLIFGLIILSLSALRFRKKLN